MSELDDEIKRVRGELKQLKREERREVQRTDRLPSADPAFGNWKVRARSNRYVRLMDGVVVPPGSPLAAEVRLEDIPPARVPGGREEEATSDG